MPRIPTPALLLLPLLSVATIAFADAGVPHSTTSSSTTTIDDTYAYGTVSENGNQFSFAVIGAHSNGVMTLSDLEFSDRLDDLQKEADRNGRGIFWFRIDGEEYRVTDPDLVKEALGIVKPMGDIGRKQGEYGAKMGELGAHMGELGALQGRMGALRAQIALHRLADDDDRADLDQLERELDEIHSDLRDLRDDYVAVSGGAQTVAGRPTDRLVLTPETSGAPFMLLEVWVDRETGFLRQVRTRTDEGVATTYTFVRLEPNARVPSTAFRFEPPAGVEVFDS